MPAERERTHCRPVVAHGIPMLLNERVHLPCGCAVHIGLRLDQMEPVVLCIPCTEEHQPLTRHCNLLIRSSLVEPQDRPMSEVVVELLDQAERYAEAPSA